MSPCIVENCCGKYLANGFCSKHYQQFKKYGKVAEIQRTKFDPNEFIIDGDICWVILYDIKNLEIARAKFLAIYYEQIKNSELKWHFGNGYARAKWVDENGNIQNILLHQAVAQLSGKIVQPWEEIDHKDGDKLNCLDNNLRVCTPAQNQRNKKIQNNNTSGDKGVTWSKKARKWQAQITVNGDVIFLGYFDTKEDAARAYNAAAIIHHGEFAVLNNI